MLQNIQTNFPPYISAQYQPANFNDLKTQVNRLDNAALKNDELTKATLTALSPIVPIRRISSLPDNIKDGNYVRAAGLVGLMTINLPEDTRDLAGAWKQFKTGNVPSYYKDFQAPFSFFRGTFLERYVNKMGQLGVKLHKADVPLYDTKFGELCKKAFKYDLSLDARPTNRFVPKIVQDESGKTVIRSFEVYAKKGEGSALGKLVGGALLRIPYLSTLILAAMEIPAIFKAFKKPAASTKDRTINGGTQILKSSVNVSAILAGIGMFGYLLKGRGGPIGSLVGMGLGSIAGTSASKEIGNKLDFIPELLNSQNCHYEQSEAIS